MQPHGVVSELDGRVRLTEGGAVVGGRVLGLASNARSISSNLHINQGISNLKFMVRIAALFEIINPELHHMKLENPQPRKLLRYAKQILGRHRIWLWAL